MARVKKRADGRYCSQIYLGRDENGKRQYKSVYGKSPAELKQKETAVRLQLGRGLDVLSQRDSFDTWADDWLRLKEKEHITYRQMDSYRRAVKLWKDELHRCGLMTWNVCCWPCLTVALRSVPWTYTVPPCGKSCAVQ